MTTLASPATPGSSRPGWVNDKRIWIGAALLAVTLSVWRPWSRGAAAEQAPAGAQPIELSGPTSTSGPRVDPLGNLGLLNPTAAAMVGADYEARPEVARRASDLMANYGASPCALVIGSAPDGSWELTIRWDNAHPVPLLASCPWPPAQVGTSSTVVTK